MDKYNVSVDLPSWHLSESSSVYCLSPHTAQVRSKHYSQMICQNSRIAEKTFQVFAHLDLDCHHFMNILIRSLNLPHLIVVAMLPPLWCCVMLETRSPVPGGWGRLARAATTTPASQPARYSLYLLSTQLLSITEIDLRRDNRFY